MANYDSVLERTAVVIVVDDSKLQSELKKATDQVKKAAKDQGDAQKTVAKGTGDAEKGFAELRAEIARLREQTARIKRDADAYLATQKQQANAARAEAAAQKELDGRIKELGLQVRNTRSAFINGRIAQSEFARSSEALKTEINELLDSTTLTTAQQLKLNIASATAERGLASVRGEASRLGLAWNVQIGLANQFGQQLRGLGPIGAAAAGGLGLIQNGFAGLQRPIDLSAVSFDRFLAAAVRAPQVLALATAAATTLAVVGLARLASSAAKVADDIDKASQSAGLSAEAFQEITFALSQNGISLEQARQGLNDFNARLGQAAQGSTGVAKAYAQLGVSIRDASGEVRDSDAVFTDLIGALSGVESAALQAAIGGQVFGEEFSRRIIPTLRGGAEGFAELRAQARELGLVISGDAIISLVEFKDEVAILQRQFQTARVEIAAAFLPILRDVLMPLIQNTVVPWVQTAADRVSTFATRFTEAGTAGDTFRAQLVDLITPLLRIADILTGVSLGFVAFANFVGGAAAAAGAAIGTLSVQFEDYLAKIERAAPLLADLSSFVTNPIGAIRAASQLRSVVGGNPFDGAAISESAAAASAGFFERGNNASLASGDAFRRAFVTGYEGLFDGLAEAGREAFARGASGAFGAPPPGGGTGTPDGTESDPVAVRLANPFGGEQLRGRGLTPQSQRGLVTIDPNSEFVRSLLARDALLETIGTTLLSDRGSRRGDGGLEALLAAQAFDENPTLDRTIFNTRAFQEGQAAAAERARLLEAIGASAISDRGARRGDGGLAEAAAILAAQALERSIQEFDENPGSAGARASRFLAERTLNQRAVQAFDENPGGPAPFVLAAGDRREAAAAAAALAEAEARLAGLRGDVATATGTTLTQNEQLLQNLAQLEAAFSSVGESDLAAEVAELADSVRDATSAADAAAAATARRSGAEGAGAQFAQGFEDFKTAFREGGNAAGKEVVDSALAFGQTVVSSALEFSNALGAALRGEASAGDTISSIGGFVGSVVSLFDPFIGGLIALGSQLAGGLFNAFAPRDNRSEAARAAGANVSGAPAVSINVTQNIDLAVASLVGSEARQAFDRANDDLRRLLVDNVLPRLGRLEAAT